MNGMQLALRDLQTQGGLGEHLSAAALDGARVGLGGGHEHGQAVGRAEVDQPRGHGLCRAEDEMAGHAEQPECARGPRHVAVDVEFLGRGDVEVGEEEDQAGGYGGVAPAVGFEAAEARGGGEAEGEDGEEVREEDVGG